jgi:hypothetical protein
VGLGSCATWEKKRFSIQSFRDTDNICILDTYCDRTYHHECVRVQNLLLLSYSCSYSFLQKVSSFTGLSRSNLLAWFADNVLEQSDRLDRANRNDTIIRFYRRRNTDLTAKKQETKGKKKQITRQKASRNGYRHTFFWWRTVISSSLDCNLFSARFPIGW